MSKEKYTDKGEVNKKIDAILVRYAKLSTENSSDATETEKKDLKSRKTILLLEIKELDPEFYDKVTAHENHKNPSKIVAWWEAMQEKWRKDEEQSQPVKADNGEFHDKETL